MSFVLAASLYYSHLHPSSILMPTLQNSTPMAPADFLRRHLKLVVPGKLLVLLLLILAFLSNVGSSQSLIEYLPGYPGRLPFELETGYVGVGKKEEMQLFYYFIKSENDPRSDPLLLWITGGPGCSGLSGLLYEIGPLTIDQEKFYGSIPGLKLSKYSWTKLASILFLDQPVGTGFSYSNTSKAYYSKDSLAATLTYDFLRKWLTNHPEYLENPLYITGDSYNGILVPLIVNEVYKGIETGITPEMNLRGYVLGNPYTDSFLDINERILYSHRMGLLSDRLYESAKINCQGNYLIVDPENALCRNDIERINQCLSKICTTHILEPWCESLWKEKQDVLSWHMPSYDERWIEIIRPVASSTKWKCRNEGYVLAHIWANDDSVQKALRVREGTVAEWVRCNTTIKQSAHRPAPDAGTLPYFSDVLSTISYHKEFMNKSCRALIYSGDHDKVIPHTSTEKWIDSLKLPVESDWRPWFVEDQVAGYTMTYGQGDSQLTYATVKDGGHTAPEYKPKECYAMIKTWFGHGSF